MKYLIYKITNLVNGKLYIGAHKTNDIEDDYMGSGKILTRAINKYGVENFQKEILEVFDNSEDMFKMEAKLVDECFVHRKDTYNLKEGGFGGFDYINRTRDNTKVGFASLTKEERHSRAKYANECLARKMLDDDYRAKDREIRIKAQRLYYDSGNRRQGLHEGKPHTAESKAKIGLANSKHGHGDKNSQYGSRWMYNEETRSVEKVKEDLVNSYKSDGWEFGRILNFDELDDKKANILEKERKKVERELKKIEREKVNKLKQERKLLLKTEEEKKKEAEELFEQFIKSECRSLRAFCKEINYEQSIMTLSNHFRKYIPEYSKNSKVRVSYKLK